jgi:hypothetical protein
MKLSETMSD